MEAEGTQVRYISCEALPASEDSAERFVLDGARGAAAEVPEVQCGAAEQMPHGDHHEDVHQLQAQAGGSVEAAKP